MSSDKPYLSVHTYLCTYVCAYIPDCTAYICTYVPHTYVHIYLTVLCTYVCTYFVCVGSMSLWDMQEKFSCKIVKATNLHIRKDVSVSSNTCMLCIL